jgi:hypothetical protein
MVVLLARHAHFTAVKSPTRISVMDSYVPYNTFRAYQVNHKLILGLVESLSDDQLLWKPAGYNNSITPYGLLWVGYGGLFPLLPFPLLPFPGLSFPGGFGLSVGLGFFVGLGLLWPGGPGSSVEATFVAATVAGG